MSIGLSSIAEFQIDSGYSRLHVTRRGHGPLAPILDFEGDETSSVEDIVLATKIRIVPEAARRPSFGFRMATKLPNAHNQSGLGTDMTDVSFAVLVGKTVRSVRLVGNIGVAIIGDPTQMAVQYRPADLWLLTRARACARLRCGRRDRRTLAGLRRYATARGRESRGGAGGTAVYARGVAR